jgi:hypothetical protein
MTPHEKKFEDDDRQAKSIVIDGSVCSSERSPLQLRRRIFRLSHEASIDLGSFTILEGVTVDDGDEPFLIDQRDRFVDIPDDNAKSVYAGYGAGEVQGDAHEKSETSRRKFDLPVPRCTKLMQGFGAESLPHHKAGKGSLGGYRLHGECDERRAFKEPIRDHRAYFCAPVGRFPIGIKLNGERTVTFDSEYLAFASFPDSFAEPEAKTRRCHQISW